MKRMLAWILCAALMAAALPSLGETVTANGVVEARDTAEVVAPCAGVLQDFDIDRGDEIAQGDALFTFDTVKVYSPESGVLGAVFAGVGDDADDVQRQYGALALIEQAATFRVSATTAGAYNKPENKLLHVGETLQIKNSDSPAKEGVGRVLATDAAGYVVEVLSGAFELKEEVKLYRATDFDSKSAVGKGRVLRAEPVAVVGTGRVLAAHAQAGDTVRKGQLLFETLTGGASPELRSAVVTAPISGYAEYPSVIVGQTVYKGQMLLRLYDPRVMQVVAEVDELDMSRVPVGAQVSLVFDRYPDKTVPATVAKVAKLGVVKQNATYYNVWLDFSLAEETLPGMNATVYLPELSEPTEPAQEE